MANKRFESVPLEKMSKNFNWLIIECDAMNDPHVNESSLDVCTPVLSYSRRPDSTAFGFTHQAGQQEKVSSLTESAK